jgi:hypothetical protein
MTSSKREETEAQLRFKIRFSLKSGASLGAGCWFCAVICTKKERGRWTWEIEVLYKLLLAEEDEAGFV